MRRIIATALAGSLILAAPGLGPYEAWAGAALSRISAQTSSPTPLIQLGTLLQDSLADSLAATTPSPALPNLLSVPSQTPEPLPEHDKLAVLILRAQEAQAAALAPSRLDSIVATLAPEAGSPARLWTPERHRAQAPARGQDDPTPENPTLQAISERLRAVSLSELKTMPLEELNAFARSLLEGRQDANPAAPTREDPGLEFSLDPRMDLTPVAKKVHQLETLSRKDQAAARTAAVELLKDSPDRRIGLQVSALRILRKAGLAEALPGVVWTLREHLSWYLRREAAKTLGEAFASNALPQEARAELIRELQEAYPEENSPSTRLMIEWALERAGEKVPAELKARLDERDAGMNRFLNSYNWEAKQTLARLKARKPGGWMKWLLLGLLAAMAVSFMTAPREAPRGDPKAPPAVVVTQQTQKRKSAPDNPTTQALERIAEQTRRSAEANEKLAALAAKEAQEREQSRSGGLMSLLIQLALFGLLPILVLVWLMRRGAGGMGAIKQILSAGDPRLEKPRETFHDVAGVDDAIVEVQEIVDFLQNPAKYKRLGGNIPKGVLLIGPPGTGKTLLAKALANAARANFISMSGSDFIQLFVGVGASRVRDLFGKAKNNAPTIIFIDELDAIGKARSSSVASVGGHDEREQTLNQLLTELDGFDNSEGVILLAATNRPETLDPALLRPGRFDRKIAVDQPDVFGREAILEVHARGVRLGPEADLSVVARNTAGEVGADLAHTVKEGALLAARRDADSVGMQDLNEAINRRHVGQARSLYLPEELRVKIAFHEAGHTLIRALVEGIIPSRLTIIPHGSGALGFMSAETDESRHYLMTKSQLQGSLASLLGGRAAEELIYGETSTGPGSDLREATRIARMMVERLGMSEAFGLAARLEEDNPFGIREEDPLVRREVNVLLKKALDDDSEILSRHRAALEALQRALLEKETIFEDEIRQILADAGIDVDHLPAGASRGLK